VIEQLPIFPCNAAKEPLTEHGFKDARRGANWKGWPLVGFATGAASGIDVLDIDPDGRTWFDANFDALPTTRAHSTQRGLHLLFKHAPGLRCSTDKIADGVDVRADGGYAVWWPREGLPIEEAPICEWPEWLLKEARGAMRPEVKNLRRSSLHAHVAHGVLEALCKMDPCEWNGDWDRWFELLMACKYVGIARDDFIEWSVSDPDYAGEREEIARQWQSVVPKHGGAFYAALKARGIRVGRIETSEVPYLRAHKPNPHKARDWRNRFDGIRKWLCAHSTEPDLFSASCLVAEIAPHTETVKDLLEQAVKETALWQLLGRDGVRKTIERGFDHIERKA
jgi:hypothetical protein